MRDVAYLLIALMFFALCVGYVGLCDRIIGPDPDHAPEDAVAEASAAASEVLP